MKGRREEKKIEIEGDNGGKERKERKKREEGKKRKVETSGVHLLSILEVTIIDKSGEVEYRKLSLSKQIESKQFFFMGPIYLVACTRPYNPLRRNVRNKVWFIPILWRSGITAPAQSNARQFSCVSSLLWNSYLMQKVFVVKRGTDVELSDRSIGEDVFFSGINGRIRRENQLLRPIEGPKASEQTWRTRGQLRLGLVAVIIITFTIHIINNINLLYRWRRSSRQLNVPEMLIEIVAF